MEIGLSIIRAIQSVSSPALDVFFQTLTQLGEPLCLILVFTALYWTADKQKGEQLAYTLAVSLPLCGLLKAFFRAPRPIGQPGIRSLATEMAYGYSFPSGHSQNAAAAYGALALMQRRPLWRWGCGALMLLVGLSRLYLGVHYPRDVLAGLALGLCCAWGAHALLRWAKGRAVLYLVSAAALLPFLFLFGGHDLSASEGCLVGFLLASLFERRFVGFTTEVPARIKVLRWVIGLVLLSGLAGLLGRLPSGDPYTFLRYALLVFAGAGLYPWLFTAVERALWKRRHYLPKK